MIHYTNRSPITGENNTMEFDMLQTVFEDCYVAWSEGANIQDAFPMLDADQREFIKTGLTPEDWFMLFGDDREIEGLVTNA
jgi:hypothetical protein